MKKLHAAQQGYSLLEVMVATVITGMLVVLIMNFMITTVVNHTIDSARADLLREAQLTLDNIGREIRLSANADEQNRWEDANAPGAPANELSWESDVDTLVLATAAINSSKDILFSDPLHYVSNKNNNIYFVSNGVLYKRILADPVANNVAETTCPPSTADSCQDDRALVDTVLDFTVRYYNNESVEVDPADARSVELTLQLQKERYGRTIDAEFSTRTVFRNE
ncbi:MAG TPA: prepilin-type N-terminal cleavage/methylation domain-containing protein [Candidatus Limnocylindria bacterium]|nr:prepilin-type N-terminal cleavage/methylation domain-containing protein [Candidatus Limnocylindria bacterium]